MKPRYLVMYPHRISRPAALAIVERGGDYVVHAAVKRDDGVFVTACGCRMRSVMTYDKPEPDCQRCRKYLLL